MQHSSLQGKSPTVSCQYANSNVTFSMKIHAELRQSRLTCFQVAGSKYLRLYDRQQTPMLYIDRGVRSQTAKRETRAQQNISAVNVEQPDLTRHPKFANAEYLECILGPGDMLYIPAKYWHYVRSLSPAMSINFWY